MPKPNKWNEAQAAKQIAIDGIRAAGFADILNAAEDGINLEVHDRRELVEMCDDFKDKPWVGLYVRNSVDSALGVTVYLNVTPHKNREDMADTICHEVGHALWELLDDQARREWEAEVTDTRWGPEEAFADEFMYLVRGMTHRLMWESLFRQITQVGQPN